MNRIAALLFAALFSQVAFSASHVIEAYQVDPVEVLDEQGKFQRPLPRKDVPAPLPVLQYNEDLDLVQVELAGQKVWLDTADLRVNPPLRKGVDMGCQTLSTGKKADSQNNSTMGYGAGCNR